MHWFRGEHYQLRIIRQRIEHRAGRWQFMPMIGTSRHAWHGRIIDMDIDFVTPNWSGGVHVRWWRLSRTKRTEDANARTNNREETRGSWGKRSSVEGI